MTKSTTLKWHGGKAYLARQIVAMFPVRGSYTHYVEPFFGGGSVLFAHDPADVSEVVNDLDGSLTNLWRVLQVPALFDTFCRRIEAMPFSEELWREAFSITTVACADEAIRNGDRDFSIDVNSAVQFFIRCRQSRAGQMKDFATVVKRRLRAGMNENVSAWQSAVLGLPAVHARLWRVLILNRSALDVIRTQDSEQTVFYLDPPYLPSTRTSPEVYKHEMSEQDHAHLLTALSKIKGRFLLSGYPSQLYEDFVTVYGWKYADISTPNHAAGGSDKRIMTERVWRNF